MNLLIVDDEIYAIQGILDSVNWDRLDFDNIFTANSYSQALNIFQNEKVAILVCDIEMPYGTGLDLVEWVREHYPNTLCIFLTCHDEFQYAKQAISLKCFDYVLKPIPPKKLLEILQRASDEIKNTYRTQEYLEYGKRFIKELSEKKGINEEEKVKDPVNEVEHYIQNHISDNLTVEEIAKIVFLSPDYLTRLFKKQKGQTLIDYITSQRMFLAKELLESNVLTISMISAKVGYGNYSYFTKIFKKYYGKTPRDYQNQYLKGKKC